MTEELLGADLKLQIETRPEYAGLGADLMVNIRGDLETIIGRENLGQAILHRLITRVGELGDLGHPHYGSRLHELIGEPNNERTHDLLRLYIKECLSQEPRVKEILSLKIDVPKENPYAALVDLTILPIKSNLPMNLVFPFYLEVG
jgi:phage baseplate assembly protein W